MPKFNVGQEVYFMSGMFSLNGTKIKAYVEQAVIDSVTTTSSGTSYTFEGLTYRLPESEVFETRRDCEKYIKEEGF